jgi:hypothetical protein
MKRSRTEDEEAAVHALAGLKRASPVPEESLRATITSLETKLQQAEALNTKLTDDFRLVQQRAQQQILECQARADAAAEERQAGWEAASTQYTKERDEMLTSREKTVAELERMTTAFKVLKRDSTANEQLVETLRRQCDAFTREQRAWQAASDLKLKEHEATIDRIKAAKDESGMPFSRAVYAQLNDSALAEARERITKAEDSFMRATRALMDAQRQLADRTRELDEAKKTIADLNHSSEKLAIQRWYWSRKSRTLPNELLQLFGKSCTCTGEDQDRPNATCDCMTFPVSAAVEEFKRARTRSSVPDDLAKKIRDALTSTVTSVNHTISANFNSRVTTGFVPGTPVVINDSSPTNINDIPPLAEIHRCILQATAWSEQVDALGEKVTADPDNEDLRSQWTRAIETAILATHAFKDALQCISPRPLNIGRAAYRAMVTGQVSHALRACTHSPTHYVAIVNAVAAIATQYSLADWPRGHAVNSNLEARLVAALYHIRAGTLSPAQVDDRTEPDNQLHADMIAAINVVVKLARTKSLPLLTPGTLQL